MIKIHSESVEKKIKAFEFLDLLYPNVNLKVTHYKGYLLTVINFDVCVQVLPE